MNAEPRETGFYERALPAAMEFYGMPANPAENRRSLHALHAFSLPLSLSSPCLAPRASAKLPVERCLVAPWKANRPTRFHSPVGCLDCRMTGYRGCIGLYEVLPRSADIKQAIADHAGVAKVRGRA